MEVYGGLRERIKQEWITYLLAFLFIGVADKIGQIRIPVWIGTCIIFPIFFALVLGLFSGPNMLKLISDKQVNAASKLAGIAILPFVAKLGVGAGANIMTVISAGPALLLQEFGNVATMLLALPVALLLGLKRESIGATYSINRESNLALIQDMYGASSPEAQGCLAVYILISMLGTIYFGFMATVFAATQLFHPYALGMASGVGAGILVSSAIASLSEVLPEFAEEITAFASVSETVSEVDGLYISLFIAISLCNWLYDRLEPKLGRITKRGRAAAAELEKKAKEQVEQK